MRRIAPAILLFFLSPLVAEYLLGDFTLAFLYGLLLLAPMYGGGALLIREVVRRSGRGWPSIVLLALAYGVFEEGITTQSLFDPDYADAHLLDHGFIPALGIAVPWTLFVLTLHTVWSISVPIALTEELTANRRTSPWLRTPGLTVATVLFVIGSVATFATSYATDHFVAPWPALAVVVAVAVALVVVALRLPRVETVPTPTGDTTAAGAPIADRPAAPPARIMFVAALAAGFVFMSIRHLPTWIGPAVFAAGALATVLAVRAWSRRPGWNGWHRMALAGGALLTYAWNGFLEQPIMGDGPIITPVSHVVFGLAAVALLALELRAVRSLPRATRRTGQPAATAVNPAG
ncbi:hypothetical protein GCM10023322_80470 [Rugosimonospora acidiphila]|uniref:Uncharacterized protein n=1 Tax=Rugosimonospora acidiphila TaxID=556531 RepID=A0ABP9SUS5_9ACTN